MQVALFFFFSLCLSLDCNACKVWEFWHYDLHANGGASSLSISGYNVITLGRTEKPKVLKSSKWWAEGSAGFCISHLRYGFKKKGERGQLNMHIIWGYIWSLGFKLLDERQLWINVIFSLTFGHLLRAWKKAFVCAFAVNILYYSCLRFIVLIKQFKCLSNCAHLRCLFAEVKLSLMYS